MENKRIYFKHTKAKENFRKRNIEEKMTLSLSSFDVKIINLFFFLFGRERTTRKKKPSHFSFIRITRCLKTPSLHLSFSHTRTFRVRESQFVIICVCCMWIFDGIMFNKFMTFCGPSHNICHTSGMKSDEKRRGKKNTSSI